MVILKNSKQEKIEDKWNYYQIADIISPRKIIISNYFKKLYFIKESKRPKYELWTSVGEIQCQILSFRSFTLYEN